MNRQRNVRRTGPNSKKEAAKKQAKLSRVFGRSIFVVSVIFALVFAWTELVPLIEQRISPYILITDFTVRGGEDLDLRQIDNILKLDGTAHIFNVSTDEIARQISAIEGVQRVRVRKRPFSQSLCIRITQRTPTYLVNIDGQLFWADSEGFLWQSKTQRVGDNIPLIIGLDIYNSEFGRKIACHELQRLQRVFSAIRGSGRNADKINSIFFRNFGVIEFTARNISVPVRLNGTLRFNLDDFVNFEDILRRNRRSPALYIDAFEHVVYAR